MNILTFGLLLGDLKIDQFTVTSKVIATINDNFPNDEIILLEMCGRQIIDVYKKLPYEKQIRIVEIVIMEGLEERNFYKELELSQALSLKNKEYNSTVASDGLLAITVTIVAIFGATALMYKHNALLNQDYIEVKLVPSILEIIKYVILNFV